MHIFQFLQIDAMNENALMQYHNKIMSAYPDYEL